MNSVPQSPPTMPIGAAPRSLVPLHALLVALAAGYALPLWQLGDFALKSDLFSYILIVPAVTGYLLWPLLRGPRPASGPAPRIIPVMLAALGAAALASRWISPVTPNPQDTLAPVILSFVLLVATVCSIFLDAPSLRRAAFPLAFLLFMVPFPKPMEDAIETFLQHGSAPVAHVLFLAAQTPVFAYDLTFELPGIALRVAPECSGIRSTLVLFMTSLVAGHMFLRSPWRRGLLTAFVVPLALVRNGFRIFTIGELCVHIGPHMIDSAIHHKGGSIFFALSLIPFLGVLFLLVRGERRARPAAVAAST